MRNVHKDTGLGSANLINMHFDKQNQQFIHLNPVI